MTTYIVIAVFSIFLSYIVRHTNREKYLVALIVVFLPFFLYGVLRYDCMDFEAYERFYESTHGNRFWDHVSERIEYGWAFLNYIMPNFFSLILLQTSALVLSYVYVCKKYINPQYLILFVVLLFLAGDKTVYFLTGMRNTMAIALLLFSLPLIEKRNLTYFAIVTVIASLFHTSALVFLPLAYLIGRNCKMTNKEVWIWVIVLIALLLLPLDYLVSKVSMMVSGNIFEKYSSYLRTSHETGVLAKSASVIFSGIILYDLSKHPIDSTHLMLGRLALLFFYFPLLGSLNLRGVHYFCVSLLLYSVYTISKRKISTYRLVYIIALMAYLSYAFFVIDASTRYSGLTTFKTLLDNLW